ncbi:MAG: GNAT family N-acetyltransferase [Cyanobacteria bacterium P01_E01_bin.48]
MIRLARPNDVDEFLAIAAAALGFEPEELAELSCTLAEYFECDSNSFWLANCDDEDCPVGVAYCSSERMTSGTWNLLFIAIHPDRQNRDHRTTLIRAVEQKLSELGLFAIGRNFGIARIRSRANFLSQMWL